MLYFVRIEVIDQIVWAGQVEADGPAEARQIAETAFSTPLSEEAYVGLSDELAELVRGCEARSEQLRALPRHFVVRRSHAKPSTQRTALGARG